MGQTKWSADQNPRSKDDFKPCDIVQEGVCEAVRPGEAEAAISSLTTPPFTRNQLAFRAAHSPAPTEVWQRENGPPVYCVQSAFPTTGRSACRWSWAAIGKEACTNPPNNASLMSALGITQSIAQRDKSTSASSKNEFIKIVFPTFRHCRGAVLRPAPLIRGSAKTSSIGVISQNKDLGRLQYIGAEKAQPCCLPPPLAIHMEMSWPSVHQESRQELSSSSQRI
ncbi:hypothetical protein ACOMHN_000797 [Nucella lapillus]